MRNSKSTAQKFRLSAMQQTPFRALQTPFRALTLTRGEKSSNDRDLVIEGSRHPAASPAWRSPGGTQRRKPIASRYVTRIAGGAAGITSSPGSTSACCATSGSPAPTRAIRAASRFGRSDSHANDIDADPGAPGWNLAPHGAGCRQMVFTGGQRDRAALCEARSRPLGGLAALPAVLSGVYQTNCTREAGNPVKVIKDQTTTSYDDLSVKVAP